MCYIYLCLTLHFAGELVTLPCDESIYLCGPSCGDRISNNVGVIINSRSPTEPRYSCRCDRRCALYNDCCQDYWENCVKQDVGETQPITASVYSPYVSCLTQQDSEDKYYAYTDSYWAVTRCPEHWTFSDEVRGFCEDVGLNSERFFSLYGSGPDGTVFRNIYCAMCHGVDVGTLKMWSSGVYLCPKKGQCFLALPPDDVSADPHLCQPNVIDYCPSTSGNNSKPQTNQSTCHDITAFLFDVNNRLAVKNPTCIDCNAFPNTSFSCIPEPFFGQLLERSLLILFYFGGIPGGESHTSVLANGIIERHGECGPNTLFDPFELFCRPIPYRSVDEVATFGPVKLNESRLCLGNHLETTLYNLHLPIAIFAIGLEEWIARTTPSRSIPSRAKPSFILVVLAHYEEASRVLESLETFLEQSFDPQGDAFQCEGSDDVITYVTLIMSEQPINETHPEIPECDGYIVENVNLEQVSREDNYTFSVYLENDLPFKQRDLIHQTTFRVNNSHFIYDALFVSTSSSVKVCSPLAGDQNDCFVTNQSYFQMDQSREALIHTSSGHVLNWTEFWLLPGNLVKVCNLTDSSQSIRDLFPESLYTLSKIGESLSLGGLLFTLVTYCIFPSLRTLPGSCVIHLVVALIISDFTLLLGNTTTPWLCTLRALFLHFSWLVVFCWMNVIAGSLAIKLHQVPRRRDNLQQRLVLFKLSLYAWGCPFVFVTACFVASLYPSTGMHYGGTFCWIESLEHSLITFGLPVAVILSVNSACLIYTIGVIVYSNNRVRNHGRREKDRSDLLVCVKVRNYGPMSLSARIKRDTCYLDPVIPLDTMILDKTCPERVAHTQGTRKIVKSS